MVTRLTSGIKISVESSYKGRYVSSDGPLWVFHYNISITNQGPNPVKLLRRKWYLWDSNAAPINIEGDGVVGLQPEIPRGGSHAYQSGCHLKSGVGFMRGSYQMLDLLTNSTFEVEIPLFHLLAPQILN